MKILIVGDPFSSTGYSLYCRELILSLIKNGQDVYLLHHQQDPYQDNSFSGAKLVEACATKYNKLQNKNFDVVLRVSIPVAWNREFDNEIGVFCYEADSLPEIFIQQINKMDGIITSSTFCRDVFTKHTNKPIEVAPWYVSKKFDTTDVQIPDFGDNYVFLSVFQWGTRKGWDLLLRAYWAAFRNNEKVALVIKTCGKDYSKESYDRIIHDIQALKHALWLMCNGQNLVLTPKIHLIIEPLSDNQMAALYKRADCFVLPTCGEGYGRTFLEASEYGTPIITTDWSGHLDFLNKTNACLLPYIIEPCVGMNGHPNFGGYYDIEANMARCDILALKNAMRNFYVGMSPQLDKVDTSKYSEIHMAELTIAAINRIKDNKKTTLEVL